MGEGVRAAFGLAGGLALFLFGMENMSRALQQAAGERMRGFLRRVTRTPLTGALAGLLVTAVLQSSSATTVMVIGFVSAGLMELPQAVAVVFGANMGTTMTAQLVAFRLADWVFPILFAGVLVWLLARRERTRQLGLAVFSFGLLLQIARIAIPSTLQQSFVSVGNILLQRVINGFGASVIAGYSASIKLNNLVVTSLVTLGNGISNFTAQNLGANRPDRVHGGFRAGFKLVWLICIPFALLYAFAGQYLLRLFLDDPAGKAMATGVELLRIVAPGYFLVSAKLVADGVLRGSGLMKRFMLTTLIDLVLRVGLAKLFASSLGTRGIWIAFPIGWAISMCLSLAFYWNGPWRKAQPVEPAAGDN